MRIGVFGGTFDPPHFGHLILAAEAKAQMELDLVLWMLTPDPPHKRNREISPASFRKELVLAAIREEAGFSLSTVEIDRQGPHYAVDTLKILKNDFPNDDLFYIMGADSLHDLPAWYQPKEFISLCQRIVVMDRHLTDVHLKHIEAEIPGVMDKVEYLEVPLIEISSSMIRERIKKGKHFKYYLPEKVFKLIQTKQN
ncbi:MAG: nicotinate (nicotinamide) nucleotide adenylyltransferase [Anaerolineaceae bacterium]|nr:nicotinate (nicotinamide) nucleotide adenylyltransferase [Anaerolineaceae bacterium]